MHIGMLIGMVVLNAAGAPIEIVLAFIVLTIVGVFVAAFRS